MFSINNMFVAIVALLCAIESGLFAEIPSYIHVCKRDQSTINACLRDSIEFLRPMLAEGIPELEVPSIDPFYIPEIKPLEDVGTFRAMGKDIKVTGGGNFTIKSLSVDLNTFLIKAHVRFPKLHFDGRYKLDAQILTVPLKGQGTIIADAIKCDAELVVHSQLEDRDGKEYITFPKMDADINVKDYRIRLEGLFNGDKVLGQAANAALNENKMEFFRVVKPELERQVTKILLKAGNVIAASAPLDDLLPYP